MGFHWNSTPFGNLAGSDLLASGLPHVPVTTPELLHKKQFSPTQFHFIIYGPLSLVTG